MANKCKHMHPSCQHFSEAEQQAYDSVQEHEIRQWYTSAYPHSIRFKRDEVRQLLADAKLASVNSANQEKT